LRKLPELQKMYHRLLAALAKKQMASVGSSHNGCTIIGILRLSQGDMPTDIAQYATVGEADAEL
jgi:hypothetical protein